MVSRHCIGYHVSTTFLRKKLMRNKKGEIKQAVSHDIKRGILLTLGYIGPQKYDSYTTLLFFHVWAVFVAFMFSLDSNHMTCSISAGVGISIKSVLIIDNTWLSTRESNIIKTTIEKEPSRRIKGNLFRKQMKLCYRILRLPITLSLSFQIHFQRARWTASRNS